jgi:hypothetical protein
VNGREAKMTRLERLKQEARLVAEDRGHDMSRFAVRTSAYAELGWITATCRRCGAGLVVVCHPKPNELAIGGRAPVIDCEGGAR